MKFHVYVTFRTHAGPCPVGKRWGHYAAYDTGDVLPDPLTHEQVGRAVQSIHRAYPGNVRSIVVVEFNETRATVLANTYTLGQIDGQNGTDRRYVPEHQDAYDYGYSTGQRRAADERLAETVQ